MDRFEWLKCQPWLVPASSLDVNWRFEGFASFYICAQQHPYDVLSEDATHLFFSVQPSSSLDPAQFAFKLGLIHHGSGSDVRDIILSFDNMGFCFSDVKQVVSINAWTQEQGCKLCQESSDLSACGGRENRCACQFLPVHVTVRLKHVSMVIYSCDQSHEACQPGLVRAMDVLCKGVDEQKLTTCHDVEGIGSDLCVSCSMAENLCTVLASSKKLLQQFLNKLDCMSECTLGAVEVCHADAPWMARLLHVVIQHAADNRRLVRESKSVQCQLQSCLKVLEGEEQAHISSIWASSASTQQQDAKLGVVTTLQKEIEQRKELEEAILWLELVNSNSFLGCID